MKPDTTSKDGIQRGQKSFSALVIIIGIGVLWTQKPPASIFICCGFLLYAWSLLYYRAPDLRSTLPEIYQSSRRGIWFTPKYARLVMLLAVILMLIGEFFPFS